MMETGLCMGGLKVWKVSPAIQQSLQNEHRFLIKFSTLASHGGVEKELQIINLYENSALNQNPPRSALQHLCLEWVMLA